MSKLALAMPPLFLVLAIAYVEIRMPSGRPTTPASGADTEAVKDRLDDLETRIGSIEQLRERLDTPPPLASGGPSAAPVDGPDLAPSPGEPTEPVPAGAPADPKRAAAVTAFLEKVADGHVSREELSDLWDILAGSGLEKQTIAALQTYASERPNDADAQYGVGVAMISALMGGQVTMRDTQMLSAGADQAFDRALKIDDNHFDARLSKAISYTFWPDALGKGPEAIRHFETLRERNRADASQPMMEEVYRNLGVQYLKAGSPEKAAEALREGLTAFPDSEALKVQLEAATK